MNVQSQLLLLGVLPDIKIMVAERKRVDRLVGLQHTRSVPLPSYRYGRKEVHIEYPSERNKSDAVLSGLSKPPGNVGQSGKDIIQVTCSQAHKLTFCFKINH